VEPVLGAALLPWFFVTPIFLPVEDLPGVEEREWLGDLLEWGNPVAPFVDSVREVLFAGAAPGVGQLAYMAAATALALGLGALAFRRLGRDLAVVV
jgi:ABC-type polysaccharide/polyol phosphate export permease